MTGLWVVLGTLVVAGIAGALLQARNGRVRAARRAPAAELPAPVAAALDTRARVTLVQISTTFCTPCRHTRALLGPLAERTDGLTHVDLDVTNQPEVAQALGVLRTPTTIAYGADGTELLRVGGVPKAPALLEALAPHLPARVAE
ncbi:TlpA family protein disulfide reductase [Amycolatopsis thermophila]|uniref:Thiol-disulfide isomerase/thioredoxin n=1 Tax=Amycolatopsis thermophila TaxID=206084 RepID=A0ABU0ETS4_9PSEU|nr:thioredoxin family protein [Amycolatopsis thermophila]MDQ0378366.1 thiol-disulfide isomerase/thioredoxin [Amycolatopsis thermophila]